MPCTISISEKGSDSNPFEGFRSDLRTQCLVAAGLSALFFTIYYQLGRAFTEILGYYDYGSIFFGVDHLDAIGGWVKSHKGTHPLVLLFVVPAGWLLDLLFGSYETGVAVFGAAAGGASVAAAAALSLAANAGIHAVYGTQEIFLYTPHFAFLMLFLCFNEDSARGRWVPAAWWLLAGLTGANNLWVVRDFLDRYAG